MYDLLPLKNSHTANQVEAELNELVVLLYQKYLYERVHDANVSGIPFLGSYELVTNSLVTGNVATFDTSSISDADMRYLLLAYKYRNGKRGIHFLKTFLKCVWGNEFEVNQLWQHKSKTYPLDQKSRNQITEENLNIDDYFLTSRLRISLISEVAQEFPMDVAQMLRNTLPARLFIAEISQEQKSQGNIYIGTYAVAYSVVFEATEFVPL